MLLHIFLSVVKNDISLGLPLMLCLLLLGVVSEQEGEMAKNREVLGQEYHYGGIWPLWCYGEAFPSITRYHPEKRQRKRVRRSLAAR